MPRENPLRPPSFSIPGTTSCVHDSAALLCLVACLWSYPFHPIMAGPGQNPSTERADEPRRINRENKTSHRPGVEKNSDESSGKGTDDESEAYMLANFSGANNYPRSPKELGFEKVRENPYKVHYKVYFPGDSSRQVCGWFMFKLLNPGGKRVQIDLTNIGRYDNWTSLNPVYAEIPNLSKQKYFESEQLDDAGSDKRARNGSMIPDTSGQHWKYFSNVQKKPEEKTLVLRERLSSDKVFIAMRPPYMPSLHNNIMRDLRDEEGVQVHRIGRSEQGDPLHIVQVGGLTEKKRKQNPCVLTYAREHADEHDTSFVTIGQIYALLRHREDHPVLRNTTFLIVPLLDPIGARRSFYERITQEFMGPKTADERSRTQKAYLSWMRDWVTEGYRLSMVISLHNIESAERNTNFFNGYLPAEQDQFEYVKPFHDDVLKALERRGFKVSDTYERGAVIDTFGGVLHHYFEPPHLLYEVNSQAKANHLDLRELYKMGGVLAFSAAKYLHRDIEPVRRLFRDIRVKRRKRKILVERYQPLKKMGLFDIRAPLDAEQYLWALPGFERIYLKEKRNGEVIKDEAPWMYKIYRQEGVTPENVPEFGLE